MSETAKRIRREINLARNAKERKRLLAKISREFDPKKSFKEKVARANKKIKPLPRAKKAKKTKPIPRATISLHAFDAQPQSTRSLLRSQSALERKMNRRDF